MSARVMIDHSPCSNCPWRRGAPLGLWGPQHFVDIARECRDDGTHVMLCHKAGALPEDERPKLVCMGWAAVLGFDAIGVRIAVLRGYLPGVPRAGVDLFASFEEMLDANGVQIPPRNRRRE